MGPVEDYIRGWRRRAEQRLADRQARAERARALLPRLVARLVAGYHPGRIWLIGSLVEGGFGDYSDIDLVVEGLDGAAVFRAGADLDELAAGAFRIDLIPAEDAYPALLDKVRRHGELLHER